MEAAKELLEMVKHAPEYTLWVLLGILFYKVFIAGSWIMIARLLILKTHHIIMNPQQTIKEVEYKFGRFYLGKENVLRMEVLLDLVKEDNEFVFDTSQKVSPKKLDKIIEYARKVKEERK